MEELDLKELMSILWRKKIIIVFIVLLFVICGAVYSYNFVKPMYKSTTTIILGKVTSSTGLSPEFDGTQYQEGDMISQSDLSLNSSLIETYSELVKSKSLIEEVKNNLNINIPTEELMKNISVSRVNNSDLLEVTAISSDPKIAKEILSEVVRIFSDNVKEIYSISNVYVIDSADVSNVPYNVNHTKDIVIFTMIGIFLSMGYVLLYNIIDNTVKSSYEIENLLKSKTLITIPLNKKSKEELITVKESKAVISEAFRTLRTNIQFSSINTKGPKTLLITSCLPEEGKSYISSNLAVTFAQAGKKVILVDADMRRGRQAKIFNVPNANGLSNYISNLDNSGNELNWPLGKFIKETSVSNLNLITAGNVPPNPAELLESKKLIELVEQLKNFYEIIIFDGAPLLPITDSLLIARILENTMLVAVHNKTKKDNLVKAKNSVENVGGKIIGICLNKVLDTSGEYSDNYYYYAKTEKKGSNIKRKCKEKINNMIKKIKTFRKRLAEKNVQKEQSDLNLKRAKEEKILAEQEKKDTAIFEEERAKERAEYEEEVARQREEERVKREAELARQREEERIKREAELARQREEERIKKEAELAKKAEEEARRAEEKQKRQMEIAEEEARRAEEKAKRDAEIAKQKEEEKRLKEEEALKKAQEKAEEDARKAEEKAKEDALMAEEKAKRDAEIAKQKEEERKLKEEARKAKKQEIEHKINILKGKVLASKDKFVEDVTEKYALHKIKKEEKDKIRKEQKAIRDAEIAKIREEEKIKREELRAIMAKEREEKEAELAKQREEEKKRKEEEALKKAEEAMQKAEEKAKREAEEAKRKAEEEAKKAEDRAKREAELARQREEERKVKEAEIARKAEEDARRAEEKARRDAEIAKQKEEEKRQKEEEALRKAEEAKLTDEYLQENLYPKTKYNKF